MTSATNRGGGLADWSRMGIALAAAAGLACAAMSGCDHESAATKAVEEASAILTSLNPDGQNPVGEAFKTEKYNKVIAILKGMGSGGTEGENAAASILISQAQTGLAERPAAEAALLEQGVINQITLIRAALSERQEREAVAAAAGSFNPGPELASIEKESAEKDAQIKAGQQKKAAIEKESSDLLAKSKAKAGEAQAERREEALRRQQAATVSATMAEQILREATQYRRRADALEAEAALLEAQSAKVAPGAVEAQNTIDRLVKQKELLGVARQEVMRRQEAAKKRSAEASADGAKIAATIETMSKALADLRAGELKTAADKAMASYSQALATAKGAVKSNKASANLAVATADQAIGELHWTHAEGSRQYAALMGDLASTTPPLAGSADFKAKSEAASAEAEASLKAAVEAYQAAVAAYAASGGGDQARAAIERLNARLADALYATSSGAVDQRQDKTEPPAAAPGAGSGASAPAGGGTDLSTPKGTIQAQIDLTRARKWSELAGLYHASDPAVKALMQAQFEMMPGAMALDEACKQKFGKGLASLAGGQGVVDPSALEKLSAADFTISETGDTATASHAGVPPTTLRKIGGKWLVDADAAVAATGADPKLLAMLAPMLGRMGKVCEDLAAEVKAGKFADVQAVAAAMQQRALQPPK